MGSDKTCRVVKIPRTRNSLSLRAIAPSGPTMPRARHRATLLFPITSPVKSAAASPAFQRVPRRALPAPLFAGARLSGASERSTSANDRGKVRLVRLVRFSTGLRSTALATARGRSPLGPAPMRNAMPRPRIRRTIAANGARNQRSLRRLPRPPDLSSEPGSAEWHAPSPRGSERASSASATFCSLAALREHRPLMVSIRAEFRMATSLLMCDRSRNLA